MRLVNRVPLHAVRPQVVVQDGRMLGEAFVADLYDDWTKYGGEVLAQVRTSNPGAYVRVVASIIPRDVIVQRPSRMR
jgi:hypothetical protein